MLGTHLSLAVSASIVRRRDFAIETPGELRVGPQVTRAALPVVSF
jgi:hypothetical protein